MAAMLAATQSIDDGCTTNATSSSNKCDLIRCNRDNECDSFLCQDGYCWSYNGRPAQCSGNQNDMFYLCPNLMCSRDVSCYSLNCTQMHCQNDTYIPTPPQSYCVETSNATVNKCPFVQC